MREAKCKQKLVLSTKNSTFKHSSQSLKYFLDFSVLMSINEYQRRATSIAKMKGLAEIQNRRADQSFKDDPTESLQFVIFAKV